MTETPELDQEDLLNANNSETSLGDYFRSWGIRIRSGDIGSLPIIGGLIIIALLFYTLEPLFFSSRNFVNLLLQMAGITTLAIGIVFVLLIAEIDLSIAWVSGVGAVVMVLLLRPVPSGPEWPWPLALGVGLIVTTTIGFVQGTIITRSGVPSFIVTLAGLLIWSGVVLILTTEFSTSGAIVIQDDTIVGVANTFLPAIWGWVLFGVIIILYAGSQWLQRRSLKQQGLPTGPTLILVLQILGVAAAMGFAVWYANQDRGVPTVSVIILILLVFWSFIAGRTRFGRYVYAVGGNPEAARRAGIDVRKIKVRVFMIAGLMAGIGGVILASRLRSVDPNSGGGNLLLNAIAAAVIGGTSLFGGSGRVMSAFLGALVIASVENGMGLLGLPAGVKFVVNGLVLLAAVLIDAFARRRREESGIA